MIAMKKNNIRYNNNNGVRSNVVNNKTSNSSVVKESRKEKPVEKDKGNKEPREYKYPKLIFLFKVVAILVVLFAAIYYTDSKRLFESDKNYHDTFVKSSFDKFKENDTVDVCLFGNSHIGFSINTNVLANALGATCFTFYQGGCDMQDVYFCIKNALQKTNIKVAVIETYALTNVRYLDTEDNQLGKKVIRMQDFADNIKKEAMFDMVGLEQYLSVWSTSIRNHDFIFRDTAQINKNKKGLVKYPDPEKMYLGSTGQTTPGINDSLDAVYDSLGAKINGEKIKLNDGDEEYLKKICDLCEEYNTKIVFVTIPMYHRNIENYKQWHDLIAKLIDESKYKWLDLQLNYDSVQMRREFFENKRTLNQHVLNVGMPYFSLRLAQFLNDSCDLNLPDRTNDARWKEICYDTDCYFYYNSPDSKDKKRINICENKVLGNKVVKNAFIIKGENYNDMYIKVNKAGLSANEISKNLKVVVKGNLKGNQITTKLEVPFATDILPVKTCLYHVGLIKEFEPTDIDSIEF